MMENNIKDMGANPFSPYRENEVYKSLHQSEEIKNENLRADLVRVKSALQTSENELNKIKWRNFGGTILQITLIGIFISGIILFGYYIHTSRMEACGVCIEKYFKATSQEDDCPPHSKLIIHEKGEDTYIQCVCPKDDEKDQNAENESELK